MLNPKAVVNIINAVVNIINKVIYSVSIGFIFKNNSFFIAGTDGRRLVVCDLKVPNDLNNRIGILKSTDYT